MKMLKRTRIAYLPTPVEELPRLSAALGGPRLLIKRDDLTGLAMGGNKTRKLEYLLTQARDAGARTLITTGAAQSNHSRQTAAAARRFGLECVLVLVGEPPKTASGNLLLDRLLGAEVVWTTQAERDTRLQDVYDELAQEGRQPYLIPYGGSNAVGAAAFAYALQELVSQVVEPDWIVFASSSGGTQAGLVAGASILRYQGTVLGISVDEPATALQQLVAGLAGEICRLLEEPARISPTGIQVNADYLGEGYGVLGDGELEAIELFARTEGLLLDPVYTGRAAAGLIDLIRKGKFARDETVLFWHTGGTPAIFAERYASLGGPGRNRTE